MPLHSRWLRQELGPMLSLAVPVILAEIGWVSMGIVDTIMVGPLGPAAIGAVGVGSMLFLALAVFGIGLLLGLDTLVSQAFGAGRVDECHRWLHHGFALALLLTPLLTAVAWIGTASLDVWGFAPEVHVLTGPYLEIVIWSTLPLLLYAAFRRYLQAMNAVGPVMFALVSANLVNAAANWVLVYGHLGAPALGVSGAAWATLASRVYLAGILLAAIVRHDRRQHAGLFAVAPVVELARLRRLVTLGLPAAIQVVLEMGVFAAGGLRQRLPGLDRDFAVGFGRQREDHFGGVDVATDASEALGRPLLGHHAVELLQQFDFMLGVPAHALAAIAELAHQRPKRGKALVEVGIVAFDHGDGRHGLAGDRLDLAFFPILDVERLGDFARGIVHDRRHHHVFFDAEHFGRNLGELLGDRLVDFPVALASPHRIDRLTKTF